MNYPVVMGIVIQMRIALAQIAQRNALLMTTSVEALRIVSIRRRTVLFVLINMALGIRHYQIHTTRPVGLLTLIAQVSRIHVMATLQNAGPRAVGQMKKKLAGIIGVEDAPH